jgi:hypothetical protein
MLTWYVQYSREAAAGSTEPAASAPSESEAKAESKPEAETKDHATGNSSPLQDSYPAQALNEPHTQEKGSLPSQM